MTSPGQRLVLPLLERQTRPVHEVPQGLQLGQVTQHRCHVGPLRIESDLADEQVWESLRLAQAEMTDRSVVEQTLATYTKITPDVAPKLNLGTWPATVDVDHLQRVSDLMTQFGLLPEAFDVKPLFAGTTPG